MKNKFVIFLLLFMAFNTVDGTIFKIFHSIVYFFSISVALFSNWCWKNQPVGNRKLHRSKGSLLHENFRVREGAVTKRWEKLNNLNNNHSNTLCLLSVKTTKDKVLIVEKGCGYCPEHDEADYQPEITCMECKTDMCNGKQISSNSYLPLDF